MKFTYDKPETETREVQAILHKNRWLYQRVGKGYIVSSPNGCYFLDMPFDDLLDSHEDDVLFYRGDSITITF